MRLTPEQLGLTGFQPQPPSGQGVIGFPLYCAAVTFCFTYFLCLIPSLGRLLFLDPFEWPHIAAFYVCLGLAALVGGGVVVFKLVVLRIRRRAYDTMSRICREGIEGAEVDDPQFLYELNLVRMISEDETEMAAIYGFVFELAYHLPLDKIGPFRRWLRGVEAMHELNSFLNGFFEKHGIPAEFIRKLVTDKPFRDRWWPFVVRCKLCSECGGAKTIDATEKMDKAEFDLLLPMAMGQLPELTGPLSTAVSAMKDRIEDGNCYRYVCGRCNRLLCFFCAEPKEGEAAPCSTCRQPLVKLGGYILTSQLLRRTRRSCGTALLSRPDGSGDPSYMIAARPRQEPRKNILPNGRSSREPRTQ